MSLTKQSPAYIEKYENEFDFDEVAYQESLWFSSDSYLKARRRQQSDSMVTMTQRDFESIRRLLRESKRISIYVRDNHLCGTPLLKSIEELLNQIEKQIL